MNEKELKKYVGNRIREERKRSKLTQLELGEIIGVNHNAVSQYESGINSPEQNTLFGIARALNIKVDDLFPPMDFVDINNNLENALNMTDGLELADINFLKNLIEKTLSMEGEDREKFLESIRFTVDYYERLNKK